MSHLPCPTEHCDRTRPGHLQVCGACAAELQRALADVPELAQELETTLTRQTSSGGAGSGSETPLPYDPRATEAAAVLRSALVGWVRALQEEHAEGWPADTLPDMSAWLLARHQRLIGHAAAEEAVGEICAAVRAAGRVIDRAPDSVFAGPCGECGQGLYVRADAATARCRNPECEELNEPVDVDVQRATMLAQIGDQLLHAAMMSATLHHIGVDVPAGTIRWWAFENLDAEPPVRRRLFDHGADANGRPLYRVDEVLALHDERVAKATARQAEKARREAKQAERIAG